MFVPIGKLRTRALSRLRSPVKYACWPREGVEMKNRRPLVGPDWPPFQVSNNKHSNVIYVNDVLLKYTNRKSIEKVGCRAGRSLRKIDSNLIFLDEMVHRCRLWCCLVKLEWLIARFWYYQANKPSDVHPEKINFVIITAAAFNLFIDDGGGKVSSNTWTDSCGHPFNGGFICHCLRRLE
jgi:hypothetical protein